MATAGLFFGAGLAGFFGRKLHEACYSGAVRFRRWRTHRHERPLVFVAGLAVLAAGTVSSVALTCHCLRSALDALRSF